ncbi:MAG TPA: hypothetical protein VKU85_05555, partial [bacterium]|nr:hypothetical protein [bacterium]
MDASTELTVQDLERCTGLSGISEARFARSSLALVNGLSLGAALASQMGSAAIRVMAARACLSAPLRSAADALAGSGTDEARPPLPRRALQRGFSIGCAAALFDHGPDVVTRFAHAVRSPEPRAKRTAPHRLAYGMGLVLGYAAASHLSDGDRRKYREWMYRVAVRSGTAPAPRGPRGHDALDCEWIRRYAAVFRRLVVA